MSENITAANEPTVEQKKAIGAGINDPTVVSAAAGTGKTTMLVERVLRLISNYEDPIRADSLAIMTFTVNATQHLREKLSSSLAKRIEESKNGKERDFLAEQAVRLRNASISTINSFCLGIIKDNIEKFDLPVNITIADETKTAALQWNAINLTKQDFYSGELFSENERNLLFYSFNFENDNELFERIISVSETLSSYADSENWLDKAAECYSSIDALKEQYLPIFTEFIKGQYDKALFYHDILENCFTEYSKYAENLPDGKTKKDKSDKEKKTSICEKMSEYIESLSSLEELMRTFTASPSIEALEKISEFAQLGVPDIGTADKQNEFKKGFSGAKKCTDTIFDELAKLSVSASEEEQNLFHNRTVITAFKKLLKIYRGHFNKIKHEQGYIDFSDCELLLLDRLKNDEDFRELISSRFSCVIVDEFQDCNDVQAEIFRLIGKEQRFFVGDIKQSIYAFRGGNPEIMAKLCKGEQGFTKLPLTNNFRSRPSVINTVNDAFFGLMTEKYGGVDYNDETKLVCGAHFPDADDNSIYDTEIYAVNSKETGQEHFAAKKIYELMHDENFKITKNGVLCRPNYSDFAILLRNKGKIENYRKALSELGISSAAPNGQNILESEETALLVNYLKVIDNPLNDKELLYVLMSPLYRFTADDAAKLRLGTLGFPDEFSNETEGISECLKNYALCECLKFCSSSFGERGDYGQSSAKQKAEEYEKSLSEKGILRKINPKALAAQNDITNFRRFMSNNSIVDLIRKICADTDIYAVVCALDESKRRQANLHRFEKIAEEFVARDGGTLCDFLRFIRQIEENKRGEIEEASIPEDAENSVRIMTFHVSKGLEIPVVILAELQTMFNNSDYSGNFLINHDHFFSINFVDQKARYQANTFAHNAIKIVNRQKPIGEELRLLYVAMTRAQDKLIMIGKFSKEEKVPLYEDDFYEGTIPFKWIWRKLIQKNYSAEIITDIPLNSETSSEQINTASEAASDVNADNQSENINGEELTEKSLEEIIGKKYRNEEETVQRAKYSVTELAHKNDVMPFVLTKPSFAVSSGIKGTDVGNAYHHTMEHIAIKRLCTADDLKAAVSKAVSELCAMGKITEEEENLVNKDKISEFFSGTLGQRMLRSRRVEREFSFYAELSGDDIGIFDLGENTAIQGQIDMLFEEDDGIVIVDYKSDTKENLLKEKENYSLQVRIYAAVAPKLFGKPVKEIYLYSFSNGEAVKI